MKSKTNFITLSDLAKRYVKPDVLKSLSDVNVEAQKFEMEMVVKEFKFSLRANKFTITTFIITLLILIAVVFRG